MKPPPDDVIGKEKRHDPTGEQSGALRRIAAGDSSRVNPTWIKSWCVRDRSRFNGSEPDREDAIEADG
jgi:hypothetical protein